MFEENVLCESGEDLDTGKITEPTQLLENIEIRKPIV